MSASESSFDSSHRPYTPDARKPVNSRKSVINPQSQYLRDALDARRAHKAPIPSPIDVRAPALTTSNPARTETPKLSPDMFMEYALSEEQTAPVSPVRRRQLSDAPLPRGKTNRELTDEIQRLKDSLMTTNMRVELLRKDNSKLQHEVTQAKEELEPLEHKNNKLMDKNEDLEAQMDDMEKEMLRLQGELNEQRESNKELIAINEECSAHWENQEAAVKEAAEIITKLQEDKLALKNELLDLKGRVTALETGSSPYGHVDGTARCPSRIKSIDDSRPSTSNFGDSDYYSQADSPPRPGNQSIHSLTTSERSVRFHELSKRNRRSTQDLQKRMSAVRVLELEESPIPDMPQIPSSFQQDAQDGESFIRSSKAHHLMRPPRSLLDAPPPSPPLRPATVAPMPRAPRHEELRGLYHPDRTGGSRIVNTSRPSSSHGSTTSAPKAGSRHGSIVEASPIAPPRLSSHRAQTSIPGEKISLRHAQQPSRRQSEHDVYPLGHAQTESLSSEWAPMAPPRSTSNIPGRLTAEADPQAWLKDIDRLTRTQRQEQAQSSTQAAPPRIKFDEESITSVKKSKTVPSTPLAEGREFLFHAKEDELSFMSRMKSKIGSSKRARSRSRERVRK
ncbi:hypothetical protein P153DRAFT_375058 [Dothidotthia symphoricarpi CBS 119687]|uniref:Centrosomin N-terminal motif 1 domain-containing protein n=1 Tax=Dothidotthia symphoricarpi CBS 119687 TaxID=1392245 RepID=A0A6A6AHA0_9PLEO|nr:uncharacterized protein P153DRAFT_375058 [Dothidotthia symphoricarpi CBS 119687]KAF2130267.1 hypothetical protein P153DRAFT_375058 [Dothidotthia symphoricarpi CBS 119687]